MVGLKLILDVMGKNRKLRGTLGHNLKLTPSLVDNKEQKNKVLGSFLRNLVGR